MPPRCEFLSGNDLRSQASGDKLNTMIQITITRLWSNLPSKPSCVGAIGQAILRARAHPAAHPQAQAQAPRRRVPSLARPGGSTDCGLQWLSAVPDKSMFLLAPAPRAHWQNHGCKLKFFERALKKGYYLGRVSLPILSGYQKWPQHRRTAAAAVVQRQCSGSASPNHFVAQDWLYV
ncbi:hypothetical protein GGX14DRAFT_404617 [Mycena pura]|uniref:Uncharacterized protein n=1 Tax=Mycena pura TaxID=153505 RepID=A0AAD6UTL4_9AGAR|nr:hypothetical protein GGX14DRAFT_404617 [Mycena pura]